VVGPEPAAAEPAIAPEATGRAPAADHLSMLLRLQSTAGNRAVNALLQRRSGGAAVPGHVRRALEARSGADLGATRIHRSSDLPAAFGARSFTFGTNVHLGPGADADLPHELGHVVQQARGGVRATTQEWGVPVNRDAALEAEADRGPDPGQTGPALAPVLQGKFTRGGGAREWIDSDTGAVFREVGRVRRPDGQTALRLQRVGGGADEEIEIVLTEADQGVAAKRSQADAAGTHDAEEPRSKRAKAAAARPTPEPSDDDEATEEAAAASAPRRNTAASVPERSKHMDRVGFKGRGKLRGAGLRPSVEDAEEYSDSEPENDYNDDFGREAGGIVNYTKHGKGAARGAAKVDNRVKDLDEAVDALPNDVRVIHDVIPQFVPDQDEEMQGPGPARPPNSAAAASSRKVNQSWGATTITGVVAVEDETGRCRRFVFSNLDLAGPQIRAKAEGLGYQVIRAKQAHAEIEMVQFFRSRAGVYSILKMAVDKPHCADCSQALTAILPGWEATTSTETSEKSFPNWYNPDAAQAAMELDGPEVDWRSKPTYASLEDKKAAEAAAKAKLGKPGRKKPGTTGGRPKRY
jgi:hypothetical protein